MAAYDSYKDSGVKWLGTIPSHWELRKIKFTFDEKSVKGFPNEPLLAATQKYGVIKKEDYESRTVEAIKGRESLKLVEKDDFVISLRSFQGGIERSYERGIISTAYTILRPTHITPEYFKYLGKSPQFIKLLQSMVTGIREGQNIDYSRLKNEYIAIPPLAKQEAIVAYLDKVTGKIDRAIEVQQQMIDALNERIQIIISRAVTKGLNPDVPLRDSGIDWLGQIPEHWEIEQARFNVEIFHGSDPKTSGDIPVYGSGSESFKSCGEFKQGPTVLLGRKGSIKTPQYIEGKYWNVDTAFDVKPIKMNLRFYFFLSKCFDYDLYITSTAVPSMTQWNYKHMQIPVPPRSEQQAIVEYIDTATADLTKQVENCKRMIELLTERKQIIINQVVTGKEKVI